MKIRLTTGFIKQSGRHSVAVGGTDMSLTDLMERIGAALRKRFKKTGSDDPLYWYPREVFDDSIIVSNDDDGKMYRIPWSLEGEEIKFGEPVEVKEEYVEIGEGDGDRTVMQSAGVILQSLDKEGWQWRIQTLEFGMSLTRDIWESPIFKESLALWDGLKAFADHPSESDWHERPERSVLQMVGWWSDFKVTQTAFEATLHILPSADWLRKDLLAAFEQGKKDVYGFSIVARTIVEQVTASDGQPARRHTRIVQPMSIDVVTYPAANGRVKYALASARARGQIRQGAKPMKEFWIKRFKKDDARFQLVRQSLVEKAVQGVTAEGTVEQVVDAILAKPELVEQAMDQMMEEPVGEKKKKKGPGDDEDEDQAQAARAAAAAAGRPTNQAITMDQLPVEMHSMLVDQALEGSQLPEGIIQSIRKRLGKTPTIADATREIEAAREYAGVVAQSGQVDNPRIEVGPERLDKLGIGIARAWEMSRDEFLGVQSYVEREIQSGRRPAQPDQSLWNSVPPTRSLKDLYFEMTGDYELQGRRRKQSRITKQAQTSWLTTDFDVLLSNVMHKRLIAAYREVDWMWRRVCFVKSLNDFKQQEAILLGYFGDLPTVAQNGEYTTAAALSDDKEVYSPSKRGYTVDLTIEDLANDDLRAFGQIILRLGRAAARTLAKFVWLTNLFNNPTMNADAKALFHADHNNLQTDALGSTGLKNAITLLISQTEPGSSEKMTVSTQNLTLAVPAGLYQDAVILTDFNQEPQGNQSATDRYVRNLGITPVNLSILSDPNDWALLASPRDIDIVEIGFFNGAEEPEFFEMSGETHEKAFNNDVILRHKVRHIYGGAPVDFRGAVKSVVV